MAGGGIEAFSLRTQLGSTRHATARFLAKKTSDDGGLAASETQEIMHGRVVILGGERTRPRNTGAPSLNHNFA